MEDLVGGILGWLGTIGTFTAYVLISRGWVSADALGYSALNALGGLLGAVGSLSYGAWPGVASNLVWAVVGSISLVGALRRRLAKPYAWQPETWPGDTWHPDNVATVPLTLPITLPIPLPAVHHAQLRGERRIEQPAESSIPRAA